MKKFVVFVLLVAISIYFTNAYEFEVKTVKGTAKVQKAGKGDWISLKKGDKLNANDLVKLDNSSNINLLHSAGKAIDVNKSGEYSVQKLAQKANTKSSDVTKKLSKYLTDELADSDDMLASGNLASSMNTLGAVERALENKFSKNGVNAGFPRSSYALENNINFNWYPMEGVTTYKFTLRSDLEEVVFTKEVAGLELTLDLESIKMEKGVCYFWSVSSNDKSSDELCIYRMTDSEKTAFNEELESLKSELNETSPLDMMMLASFYSQNNLVNLAVESYKKAIELDPTMENYKLIFAKYLMSIGLNNEAEKLANN